MKSIVALTGLALVKLSSVLPCLSKVLLKNHSEERKSIVLSQSIKVIAASALAFPIVATNPFAALASKGNFRVYNANKYVNLVTLNITSSGDNIWRNDVLGSEILQPKEGGRITFGNGNSDQCLYDFRAIFSDGYVSNQYRIDVCNNSSISFY